MNHFNKIQPAVSDGKPEGQKEITCAHSPDSDDAFMFYGIACGAVNTGSFNFKQIMKDIQTLNEEAKEARYDITAISFAAYPYIKDRYVLLSCGASFGIQKGPIIVALSGIELSHLEGITVAVPGYMTTAYLLLRLAMPEVKVIMLPFNEIGQAVKDGVVDAGLIIHEGQLIHEQLGLKKIFDLGQWWYDKTNLPLPLGANVIKRELGRKQNLDLSNVLKESIIYALENREAAIDYALDFTSGMSKELIDKYIKMYVNELSVNCGDIGKEAVKQLFKLASSDGLVENNFESEFVS